jgi:hypothetical protein
LGLDAYGPGPLPVATGVVGLVVSVLGAVGTFCGFVAQVGIARRSAEISRGVNQAAVATGACVVALVGIGILFTLAAEVTAPHRASGPSPATEVFGGIAVGVLLPLALAVVLILYHRLLAAGRRALQGGPAGRYDG